MKFSLIAIHYNAGKTVSDTSTHLAGGEVHTAIEHIEYAGLTFGTDRSIQRHITDPSLINS